MPPEPRPGAQRERNAPEPRCHWDDCPHGAECVHAKPLSAAELEQIERDLAVLTLAAFTPADKPLPNASGKELANDPNEGAA